MLGGAQQAQKLGLRVPTMEDMASAERYARGSADYGAKWAYQLVKLMKPVAIAAT